MSTASPETIYEIVKLCKLLEGRCDLKKVIITVRLPNPRMYKLLPDGTYEHKYNK